jgi:hypothetical protein
VVFHVGVCRVVINVPYKKYEGDIVGKQGTVLSVTHNGWIKVQVRGAGSADGSNPFFNGYRGGCRLRVTTSLFVLAVLERADGSKRWWAPLPVIMCCQKVPITNAPLNGGTRYKNNTPTTQTIATVCNHFLKGEWTYKLCCLIVLAMTESR